MLYKELNNKTTLYYSHKSITKNLLTISIFILIGLVSSNLLASDVTGNKAPKIEFIGGGTYDWGKVKRNDGPLKAKIQVKNSGNDDLKIHSVKPACGCTTAPISKDLLKPGETATIDVTLNISKQSGRVNKGITITSNDPKNDKLTYMIKCEVEVPLTLFPKTLSLGSALSVGQEVTGKIVVSNNTDKKIKVLSIKLPENFVINLKQGQYINPKENFALEAKFTPIKSGTVNEKIIITTDSEDPELIITTVGQVMK